MFTSVVNKSSLLKNEKKKEKKRNPEVIDGEGDENGDVKIKEKWFWKQKEDETNMN